MSEQNGTQPSKPIRTARGVIDEEWMTIGDSDGKIWTRVELEEHHRIGDWICEKMALGYTAEQINAEWKDKSNQEILAAEAASKAVLRTGQRRTRQKAALNKTL